MQSEQKFFKRILDGASWGMGFGLAASLILLAGGLLISWQESRYRSASESVELVDWDGFEVLNKAYFLNESSDHDGGLHISGEIQFTEMPIQKYVSIRLTIRNESGGFVDTCVDEYAVAYIKQMKRSFNVHCDNVFSEEQFQDYDVSVSAYDR